MKSVLATASILAATALAACGDDGGSATTAASPATTTEAPAEAPTEESGAEDKGGGGKPSATGTEIVVSQSEFGPILFSAKQRAIYLFDKETSARSECYDACAEAWPPVLTDGDPKAGKGAEAKLLGTAKRDDGSTQVTYAGHPLYYYVHDPPGEVLCHNVDEFGGLWLVVQPDGEAVR